MPSDGPLKLPGPGAPAEPATEEGLRAELEALRARQQKLEEEQRRLRAQKSEPPREEPEQKERADEKPPKPPLRQRLARLPREHPVGLAIAIVVIAVLVIGGFFLWRYLESYESTDDAEVSGHIDPVSPRVNGTVIGVYTADNRSVVAGQVL
ncbi:MAG TPA: hypothetical protein VJ732_12540, partial [Bryobacteraceae bacterium]|nr:hypothetical protein [Bryobacteraceae bacterium]